jgi:long-chain acyl-CoA synthetase
MTACGPGLYQRCPTGPDDVYYLFLPLHHVYAAVCIFLYSFLVGAQVYLSEDPDNMRVELKAIRPTVFCAVPIVYERIFNGIDRPTMARIEKAIKLSNLILKLGVDKRQVLFSKLHVVFGGRIKFMFSGGANLDPKVKRFFKDVGANLIEGYGMTETTSLIAMEYPQSKALRATGQPFENLEVRIAQPDPDGMGEIILKGGNITAGYYKNPKANKDAFDQEGFFHTGDIGYLDKDNNLTVIGRKKNVLVRSNGENIAPDELVKLIQAHQPEVVRAKVYEINGSLCAMVYAKPGTSISADQLMAQVNAGLPKHKRLESIAAESIQVSSQMK